MLKPNKIIKTLVIAIGIVGGVLFFNNSIDSKAINIQEKNIKSEFQIEIEKYLNQKYNINDTFEFTYKGSEVFELEELNVDVKNYTIKGGKYDNLFYVQLIKYYENDFYKEYYDTITVNNQCWFIDENYTSSIIFKKYSDALTSYLGNDSLFISGKLMYANDYKVPFKYIDENLDLQAISKLDEEYSQMIVYIIGNSSINTNNICKKVNEFRKKYKWSETSITVCSDSNFNKSIYEEITHQRYFNDLDYYARNNADIIQNIFKDENSGKYYISEPSYIK